MKCLVSLLLLSITGNSQQNNISISQTFSEYATSKVSASDVGNAGRRMTAFSTKQETEGSPYLFANWAKGKVYLKNNAVLAEPTPVLNYNKMSNSLNVKLSAENVLEVNMDNIKSFELAEEEKTYTITQLAGLPSFLIQIYKDSIYSLYKYVNTKFYKSDYVNKGLYETGYKYDRFVDQNIYYIVSKDNNIYTIDSSNRKSFKKLQLDLPQAKTYFNKNSSTENMESDLTGFVIYLNKL